MYLYGSFLTQSGETVTVHIVTQNSRAVQVEIGDENSGVFFTTNPVEIQSSVNNTFDHLLRSQATIRLLTRDFIPDLFCTSCRDAVVNIFKGDKCVFAGFIEPQTYSQGYNEVYDEIEISCIDVLSALQFSKYRDIGSAGVAYDEVKTNAGQLSFAEIIDNILGRVCSSIDIMGETGVKFYYDGSKSLNVSAGRYNIFSELAISELLFLGEEEDNVWQQDDVLESMLKYLNLHIVQEGLQFFIFSWETVKGPDSISWRELTTGEDLITNRVCIKIDSSNASSNDTTISIGEVFNQMLLTCRIEKIEDIIVSPLDESTLVTPYSNKQKYMTEYSVDGNNDKSAKEFIDIIQGVQPTSDGASITDWYLQIMNAPQWIFPEPGTGANLIEKYCQNNANQQQLPNLMPASPIAAIVSLGKVMVNTDPNDNSPVSRIDMTNYFALSVNGNGVDDEQNSYPSETSLKENAPCAVYTGGSSGAVYSPSDNGATNYLVLSGKVVLNPIMDFTAPYEAVKTNKILTDPAYYNWAKNRTVPSRTNEKGRLYTQQYFKAATPFATPVWDEANERGLVPFTETGPQQYEFVYSAVGDSTDKISKIAVLACMLIIGDKCVVETGTDGRISDFVWRKYKTREECASDDEYYQQSFTIGFDPKIGDKLIGTEFDLQNNIDYNVGIDAEGIAIPIRKSDRLSGAVKFMILGPVNTLWSEITRRHKTWFRRTKWYDNAVPLLAHVSSIFMKAFEVKIYSDNGLIKSTGDNDIIYMSDTHETFVNRKDDIVFEINSALTLSECQQLGVSDSVKLSTPLDLSTGYGLLSIYDRGKNQQGKPEQLYVDSYYTEYHRPRILMNQKLDDREGIVSLFNLYRHPAMADKLFYVQGLSRNLIEGYAELTIKEVWND